MTTTPGLDVSTVALRLAVTLFFVLLNGFFVAAEFALVKVRGTRIQIVADQGNGSARLVQHILLRLELISSSGHSRFPLCENDLDTTVGIVHAKDVLGAIAGGGPFDLEAMARQPVFVPDTQPLGRMIVEMQQQRTHAAVVLDDHGTAVGMAFLEDAIEEIVGPIRDEFDGDEPSVSVDDDGAIHVPGDLALPEAVEILGLGKTGGDDTIGGHVVALLKRLPEPGDELSMEPYSVTVTQVRNRRIERLLFRRLGDEDETS